MLHSTNARATERLNCFPLQLSFAHKSPKSPKKRGRATASLSAWARAQTAPYSSASAQYIASKAMFTCRTSSSTCKLLLFTTQFPNDRPWVPLYLQTGPIERRRAVVLRHQLRVRRQLQNAGRRDENRKQKEAAATPPPTWCPSSPPRARRSAPRRGRTDRAEGDVACGGTWKNT